MEFVNNRHGELFSFKVSFAHFSYSSDNAGSAAQIINKACKAPTLNVFATYY